MVDSTTTPQELDSVLFGGSCACGRITYESRAYPKGPLYCHCVTCQKLSGASYQAFTDVASKSVTFYDNQEQLRYEGLPKDSIGGITFLRFSKVGERAFCLHCYSPLAMRYMHEPEIIGLTLGTIDVKTVLDEKVKEALKPVGHIFTSQNPWWCDTKLDRLPNHERFPGNGNFEQDIKAWEGKEG